MSYVFSSQYMAALPECVLLGAIATILMIDAFLKPSHKFLSYYLIQTTLIAVFVLSYWQLRDADIFSHVFFAGHYVLDSLSIVSKLFIYLFGFLALISSRVYMSSNRGIGPSEYYLLTLFSILGMSVMASANSFITVYLGLELLSLSLYALIALQKESVQALEASLKYFVLGALASALFLYGVSIVYGLTGDIHFETINRIILQGIGGTIGLFFYAKLALILILSALAFKFGAVPFHMWVPDVYEGASTPAVLLLSSAPKIAVLAISIRILSQALSVYNTHWIELLSVLAILSMFFGNLFAIMQVNFKRMLAYSSIAQVGYALLGVLGGGASRLSVAADTAYSAAMFYIVSYALSVVGVFVIITLLSRDGIQLEKLEDYRGLNARHPWLALMMLLLMFSMAGIPPTVGFFAKLGVLMPLFDAQFIWLAVLALLFSVIGAYYYLRVIMLMYFKEPLPHQMLASFQPSSHLSFDGLCVMSMSGIGVLLLGLFPNALMHLCHVTMPYYL